MAEIYERWPAAEGRAVALLFVQRMQQSYA
jgi:hypothetical protein